MRHTPTVPMDNRKVLSVYFTRVGNSDFDKDINAVSGASLMLDGETLIGNSQLHILSGGGRSQWQSGHS